jgi:hypothetical protein
MSLRKISIAFGASGSIALASVTSLAAGLPAFAGDTNDFIGAPEQPTHVTGHNTIKNTSTQNVGTIKRVRTGGVGVSSKNNQSNDVLGNKNTPSNLNTQGVGIDQRDNRR